MGIPYVEEIPSDLSKFSLIVDGIFGFSFRPPIREPFGLILKKLAQSNIPIFSIDIPSGILPP
jgi:NAD(P)H-hydrate epimerase